MVLLDFRCADNCTGACENNTCYNDTCIEGCVNGFYGQNCSTPCSVHCLNSTCARENGTCRLGCEVEYFGDMCENSKYLFFMITKNTFKVMICCKFKNLNEIIKI